MKNKEFKPMLCPNEKVDLATIKYPLLASTKLDGIRCIFKDGEMLSRSLKPIRNKKLQEKFAHLILASSNGWIFDGEIYGHGLTFQQITHFVMTEDIGDELIPDELKFYCFDMFNDLPFEDRVKRYFKLLEADGTCHCVEQVVVNSQEEVESMFDLVLKSGFEGLVLKDPNGRYKTGRGTVKEGLAFKVKPFQTFDAPIISVYERMENLVESEINELGYKHKARHKEEVASTGIAGGFIVNYEGMEQRVTLTGDEAFRTDLWNKKDSLIGQWVEFKGMLVGSKDKIRHPTFIRFRDSK